MSAGAALCAQLRQRLRALDLPWREQAHAPIAGPGAGLQAAALRGTDLAIGGKALLLKADERFVIAAFSAAHRLHPNPLRRALGAQRIRFARPEELLALTGLVPGCLPPFGAPLLPAALFVDPGLLAHPELAFTPGLPDLSFHMASADYQRAAGGTPLPLTRETIG